MEALRSRRFVGPRHQPIACTCGMFGLPALREIGFAKMVRVKRRNAVQPPFAITPRPGTDDFAVCHVADGLEVAPVRFVNGQGIETAPPR